MTPAVFAMLKDDAGVAAQFGAGAARVYVPGDVPEGATTPYASWQTISGTAENYLSERPDMDAFRVQFDVYASTRPAAKVAAEALRDALEPHGHQISFNLDERDDTTKLYRMSFDFEFWQSR